MAIGAAAGVLGLCLVGGAVGARGAEPELVGVAGDDERKRQHCQRIGSVSKLFSR